MSSKIQIIRDLRQLTNAGLKECNLAFEAGDSTLEGTQNALDKILQKETPRRMSLTACKTGHLFTYVHAGGQIASMVDLRCETDFVARNEIFTQLGRDLCLQVVATEASDENSILNEPFVKDAEMTVGQLINKAQSLTGEGIRLCRFQKWVIEKQKEE